MQKTRRRISVLLLATLFASLAALVSAPVGARAGLQTCTELVTNGGFETTTGWELGVSPVPPQYVTYTAHSGRQSLQLGITSGANVESFSSARQTVTIPDGMTQATLSFWFYAIAEAPATTDYMELALLSEDGSVILAKPWQSHNDSRLWNQMAFDLGSWAGQTFQIYFNVYNDGAGGRAALFLDDVTLSTCASPAPSGTPTPTGALTHTATPSVLPPTATRTATPGCTDLIRNGNFTGGLGDWETLGDPSGATLVSDRFNSPPYALKLGSLDVPLNGLSSARQLITIPAGSPVVNLEVWILNQSQLGPGADYQEITLLNAQGGLLYLLYRGPGYNDSAWGPLRFNLAPFAGETVYLRFAVNNDGVGGRTAMYVDDVRLTACSSGAAPTATPMPLPTATWTIPPAPLPTATWTVPPPVLPTAFPTPPVYYTPPVEGCAELTQNGGFEAGLGGWIPGNNPLHPAIVAAPVLNGAYALQLGAQGENRNSYSSVRQTVSVPWGYARTVVSFWTYTWAESGAGNDKQQFVLLGPGNVVWATPWKVLENRQAWQQHMFELVGVGGQTFDIYFAAINDGAGGRTALFLDEVHLWGCSGAAFPFTSAQAAPVGALDAQLAPPIEAQAVPVPQVYPLETLPVAPDMMLVTPMVARESTAVVRLATETPGLPVAEWTQIAIGQAPGPVAIGTPTPPPTLAAALPTPGQGTPLAPELVGGAIAQFGTAVVDASDVSVSLEPQPARFLSIVEQWPRGWQFGVIAVIAIVLAIILFARRRRP